MSRPSYLSRREGGRYFLRIRLGKTSQGLYGKPFLRASLMTADFGQARTRLMDHLDYTRHFAAAPDFETLGGVIHNRLKLYAKAGIPQTERALSERLGFERLAAQYIARANQAGYLFARQFEYFASNWVAFMNANKAAERALSQAQEIQAYEKGRSDARKALESPFPAVQSPSLAHPSALATPWTSNPSVILTHQMHQTIDAIVKLELDKRLAHPGPLTTRHVASDAHQDDVALPPASGTDRLRMSQVLKLFLAPPKSSRKRTLKGMVDAATIVQFAIDFLEDPILEDVSSSDWDRLDEALPDIPHQRNVPKEHRESLHKRYLYAQAAGWDALSRVTVSTLKNRYHHGLSKFIGWAIKSNHYAGPKPVFECSDGENLAPLARDAFEDKELLQLIRLGLFTGCKNEHRLWQPGRYFVQNHLYWGYLILLMTGMRPGELGQLRCDDVIADEKNFFFDLRPYNARNGRV